MSAKSKPKNNEEHSLLSASGASHWYKCVASAVLKDEVDNSSSRAAREGTGLHSLFEEALTKDRDPMDFKTIVIKNEAGKNVKEDLTAEQKKTLSEAVEYVRSFDLESIWVEERVFYGRALKVDDKYAFGTADVIGVEGRTLHVMDAKFGHNPVSAAFNKQMALYAAGALDIVEFFHEIDEVVFHIIQPRCENTVAWTASMKGLKAIWKELRPAARRIVDIVEGREQLKVTDFGTDPVACQYCKVQGHKNAYQIREAAKVVSMLNDYSVEAILKSVSLAECMEYVEVLEPFITAVRKQAYEALMNDEKVEGFKLVKGRDGNRKFREDVTPEMLEERFPYVDIYSEPSLLSPAQLEARIIEKRKEFDKASGEKGLTGKDLAAEVKTQVTEFTETPPGKATIARDDDARQSWGLRASREEFDVIE